MYDINTWCLKFMVTRINMWLNTLKREIFLLENSLSLLLLSQSTDIFIKIRTGVHFFLSITLIKLFYRKRYQSYFALCKMLRYITINNSIHHAYPKSIGIYVKHFEI